MFIALLIVTFGLALATSAVVARLFNGSITGIMDLITPGKMASSWRRYLYFAICVVGVSGGVRIDQIERYITPQLRETQALALTGDRWILEVYRTLIGTLSSIAWLLLVFFVVALVVYVIKRGLELRAGHRDAESAPNASDEARKS
ncbi:hypothetical protein J7355_16205 [Endozoicomonas sp. G2_2]|uniref:hypothetical protein n=1 Tax=Endozoicomonas sp. G2_2 TaxID=2821092 RepID=UPI001ADA66EC|nr:hypothetical protein [Endozoicomonas sp. G2_2]MBO9471633.1 hypothetical protein [Endozoicomonas sp. G2_2]